MMDVKELWETEDFEEMGWHDARIYSIVVPGEDYKLKLDIDYIFKWELKGEFFNFWVSPCSLSFLDVSDLKINIDFKNNLMLFISDINRFNERLSPKGKFTVWDYEIECDNGMISFSATGYEQQVRKPPVFSEGQWLTIPDRDFS